MRLCAIAALGLALGYVFADASTDDKKKEAPKPVCCEKAAKDGKKCDHACCVEAAKHDKTCEKCPIKK